MNYNFKTNTSVKYSTYLQQLNPYFYFTLKYIHGYILPLKNQPSLAVKNRWLFASDKNEIPSRMLTKRDLK